MVIKKNTILYFSGTGNSLQVAEDINNELKKFDLIKISSLTEEEKVFVEADSLGIIFPVYYSRLPLIVEQTVKKLEFHTIPYLFAVATNGGAPATVLKKLDKILKEKDVRLNSGFLLKMPKNHIFEYDTAPVKPENGIFKEEKKKIKRISDIIRAKENCKLEISKLIIDTVIDKVFTKTTNRIFEKLHMKDTEFWVNDSCISCKTCERICPVNNIKFTSEPIWMHHCERCTACIQLCPKEAIQWGNKTTKRKRYRNPNVNIIRI